MNNNILKVILGLLSFVIAFSYSIPEVSALSISGRIDKRLYQKIIRLHENEIRHCYETELMKDKTLQGKVVTVFVILPNGYVEKAEIKESTLNNKEVEQCVVEHIKTWIFPTTYYRAYDELHHIKTEVEYPYEFVSNYKPPTILEHVRVIMNEDDMKVEYFDIPPSPEDI